MRARNWTRRGVGLLAAMLLWLTPATMLAQAETPTPTATPPAAATGEPRATLAHWVLSRGEGGIEVFQMWQVAGGAGGAAEIALPLPPGSTGVAVVEGLTANELDVGPDTLVDRSGVKAGAEKTLAFRYSLPLEGDAALFSQRMGIAAEMVFVLVDTASLSAIPMGSTPLQDQGTATMGDRVLQQWVRTGVAAGETITLALQPPPPGAPAAGAAPPAGQPQLLNRTFHGGTANVMLWQRMTGSPGHNGVAGILLMGAGLAGLVTVAVILGRRWRTARMGAASPASRSGRHPAPVTPGPGPAPARLRPALLAQRQRLAGAIAALDERHAAGEVDAEVYTHERQELKQQLVRVLARLSGLPAEEV